MTARYLFIASSAGRTGGGVRPPCRTHPPMRPTIRFLVGSAATLLVVSCSDVATAPNRDIAPTTAQPAPVFNFGQQGFFGVAPTAIIVKAEGGSFTVGPYT